MTDSKSLRQRVAKAIASVEMPLQQVTLVHFKEADAAIAIVLEEAAKAVDAMPLSYSAAETAEDCAAAIRAMKEK